MRITIDTEAQEAVPSITSTPSAASSSAGYHGGDAPAAMQAGGDSTASYGAADVSGGAPSEGLIAAILAASPSLSISGAVDGGAGPQF